ncbi:uncharacterized protein LOC143768828 isoform X2 [Ranitomeya variabilis]|uniref:uncharacterized protein LOC143768828 isoform X2 n=1 Tax=Ranitomeya variabilis TaxID=490064 RepID=UPI00405723C0
MSVTAVTRVAAWPVQRDQGRACHLLSHNLMGQIIYGRKGHGGLSHIQRKRENEWQQSTRTALGSGLSLFAFMTIDIQLNSIVKGRVNQTGKPIQGLASQKIFFSMGSVLGGS